jgi:hypothetical protein
MKYIAFITLIIICCTVNLHGMEDNSIITYQKNCKIIKKTIDNDTNDFFGMINNQQLNPVQETEKIRQQFIFYSQKIIKEKNEMISQLKNIHNINDDAWKWCMTATHNIFNAIREAMLTATGNGKHETILSLGQKMTLKKDLELYGLNIDKINIKKDISKQNFIKPLYTAEIDDEAPPINITIRNPTIIFSMSQKNITKANLIKAAWLLTHSLPEITGLLYTITKESNKNYTMNTLEQTHEFQELHSIYAKLSEILPSLNNYETCKEITEYRFNNPTNIESKYEHFQTLCTIETLWKKKEILKDLLI